MPSRPAPLSPAPLTPSYRRGGEFFSRPVPSRGPLHAELPIDIERPGRRRTIYRPFVSNVTSLCPNGAGRPYRFARYPVNRRQISENSCRATTGRPRLVRGAAGGPIDSPVLVWKCTPSNENVRLGATPTPSRGRGTHHRTRAHAQSQAGHPAAPREKPVPPAVWTKPVKDSAGSIVYRGRRSPRCRAFPIPGPA